MPRFLSTIILLTVLSGLSHAQSISTGTIHGIITGKNDGEALIGATIKSENTGVVSNLKGEFTLVIAESLHTLTVSYVGYAAQTVEITVVAGKTVEIKIELEESSNLLEEATITGGRYEIPLGEVSVSTDLLKPKLLENVNSTSVDEVLQKLPGVDIIDDQPNIRGGSGYSYGAGSRVLILIDDIPFLQADAGSAQWDDIPIENIEQIEVLKGAASALYGSSALNGIINIRTAFAKSEPETKFSLFSTSYRNPSDQEQVWWTNKRPFEQGVSFSHRQKFKKLNLVLGGYALNRHSYNKASYDQYARLSTAIKYHVSDRLNVGVNANFNRGSTAEFFYWKSLDSMFVGTPGNLSQTEKTRFNIDPNMQYFDKSGNRHKLLGRMHFTDNQSILNRSNQSMLGYGEYQFHKRWEKANISLTSGIVWIGTKTKAQLYGDTVFHSRNNAIYTQLNKKWKRTSLSLGFRYELNHLKVPHEVNGVVLASGVLQEAKPVFRVGINRQVAKATYLRLSGGQGYRFPTVAERFVKTNLGGIPISPNPALTSETGWSTEFGIKQGLKIGNLKGFADIAAFWSQYQNMMEFNLVDLFITGFQSLNVGGTDIKGLEGSLAAQGKIGKIEIECMGGYTWLLPRFQQFDTIFPENPDDFTEGHRNAYNSSSKLNVLKYRFTNTAKMDFQLTYKRYSLGFSANHYSKMEAIDQILQVFIVPGLADFRRADNGVWLVSARTSITIKKKYKLSFLGNNLLNRMYSMRPGLLEAPRNFSLRLDVKF